MNYCIKVSKNAEDDIRNIIEYIDTILGNKISANNLINSFDKAISMLSNYPRINPKYGYYGNPNIEIRRRILKSYSIFYNIDDNSMEITILRVLYNGRDLEYQLLNTPTNLYLSES